MVNSTSVLVLRRRNQICQLAGLERAFGFLPVSGEGGPKSVRLDRILQTAIRRLGTQPPAG
jgi:hypothetical protein